MAVRISASSGTLRNRQRSRVSSDANSRGRAAFFEPLIATSPRSGRPPRTTILSTAHHENPFDTRQVALRADHSEPDCRKDLRHSATLLMTDLHHHHSFLGEHVAHGRGQTPIE